MTAGPSSLGGLYVTVNLDVSKAIRQLAAFDKAAKAAMRGLTLTGGAGRHGAQAAGLNQVARAVNNVGTATRKATGSMRGMQVETAKLGRHARESGRHLSEFDKRARLLGNTGGIVRGLTTAGNSLSNFRAELGNAAAILAPGRTGTAIYGMNALGRAFSQLSAAGLGAGAAVGIGAVTVAVLALGAALIGTTAALGKFLSIGFESGMAFETLIVSMETLLGGAAAAAREIGTLVQMGQLSPFMTETVVAMDKFLISQGLVSGSLRQGLIQSVLDMGAALGLADENLDSITYALAQVQARGYLSGDELRQLANQFVPVWEMLSVLPELAGKTRVELRKMAEEGAISAQMFQEAFILYSERYTGAAERQANTLRGVLQNIKDVAQAQIGLTFANLKTSPLFVVRDALKEVLDLLRQIDFRPLVGALGNLFQAFLGPMQAELVASGQGVETFFEEGLPQAINGAAAVVQGFMEVFKALYEVIRVVVQAILSVAPLIGIAFGVAFAGAIAGIAAFVGGLMILIGAIRVAGNVVAAFFSILTGNVEGFQNAWDRGLEGAQVAVRGFQGALTGGIRGALAAIDVYKALKGVNLPKLGAGLGAVGNGLESLTEGIESGTKGGGGGAGKTREAIDELARIMDSLYDLTVRWFGLRSELEKGLLGSEGFEASVDQIAAMGKQLIEALRALGAPEVVRLVDWATRQLIALAKRREELAERLKKAEQALSDAISARDSFADQIRDMAINFANALALESETTTKYQQYSKGGFGFFIAEEQTKQKSFVQSLRDRLKALKEFQKNIRALAKRGLDKGLLEQLLAAGPEQAGDIAAGLVAGGQAMVGEVNGLQNQIGNVADDLAEFGADTFYQSGVDQAQALVDGITEEMSEVEKAAEAITAVVYAAVQPWAKQLKAEGKEASTAAGAGLSAGIPAVAGAMTGINNTIAVSADRWDFMMAGATGKANTALDVGVEGWITTLETKLTEAMDRIETFGNNLVTFFEMLKFSPANVDLRRLRYNFFDGIIDLMNEIPTALKVVLFPAYASIIGLLVRLRGKKPPEEPHYEFPSYQHGGIYNAPPSGAGYALLHDNEMVLPAALSRQVQAMAAAGAGLSGVGAPEVRVYIGETELRGIVRTEVIYEDRAQAAHVIRGRRA